MLQLELEAALAKFDVKVASLIQSSLEVVPRTLHKVSTELALLPVYSLLAQANYLPFLAVSAV